MCAASSGQSRQKSLPTQTNILAKELANLILQAVSALNKHNAKMDTETGAGEGPVWIEGSRKAL